MKRTYDCEACETKNCNSCYGCGNHPLAKDVTDTYRQSVKKGYYSSTIIERRDKDGNFIGYAYNKPGE